MQKKKNEAGITLVALVITVILIFIIAGITINLGDESIDNAENDKIKTELYMVQQAITTQYAKAKSMNQTNIEVDTTDTEDSKKPEVFVGTRVKAGDGDLKNYFVMLTASNNYDSRCIYYEDYYYKLNEEDLKILGITYPSSSNSENKYEYIVNYKTGEVYNCTKGYIKGETLYVKSVDDIEDLYVTESIDNTFVDENIIFTTIIENTIIDGNVITQ